MLLLLLVLEIHKNHYYLLPPPSLPPFPSKAGRGKPLPSFRGWGEGGGGGRAAGEGTGGAPAPHLGLVPELGQHHHHQEDGQREDAARDELAAPAARLCRQGRGDGRRGPAIERGEQPDEAALVQELEAGHCHIAEQRKQDDADAGHRKTQQCRLGAAGERGDEAPGDVSPPWQAVIFCLGLCWGIHSPIRIGKRNSRD